MLLFCGVKSLYQRQKKKKIFSWPDCMWMLTTFQSTLCSCSLEQSVLSGRERISPAQSSTFHGEDTCVRKLASWLTNKAGIWGAVKSPPILITQMKSRIWRYSWMISSSPVSTKLFPLIYFPIFLSMSSFLSFVCLSVTCFSLILQFMSVWLLGTGSPDGGGWLGVQL